ncbi:MAG: hypothetical protein HYU66_23340, partial [Armatimonadetes bacterium]|nr:hypothetical protein [Armatimonadota bacterium]
MRRCHLLAALLAAPCWAFYPAVTSGAGITLEIPDQAPFTALDTPRDVRVRITNTGAGEVAGEVRVGLTDAWHVAGQNPLGFTIPQGEGRELRFAVAAGQGTYRALYPIHAYATVRRGGRTDAVHAVLVVSAEPPEEPAAPAATELTLAGRGAVPLARLHPAAARIDLFGGESYAFPAGQINDPRSRATWQVGIGVDRGGSRPAIGFHPPWLNVKGTVSGDYGVKLPDLKPIALGFGLAIRDNTATEPPSDGVTFRVLVAVADGPFQAVFERHTAAKVWEEHSVDLSAFAGQAITIRLLGHPGPKEDTTCDSAYWGNPVLRVGEPAVPEAPAAKAARAARALGMARTALKGQAVNGAAWALRSEAARCGVAVVPGPLGVLDAQLAFAAAGSELVFDGFEVNVGGVDLLDLLAGAQAVSSTLAGGRLTITHQATVDGRNLPARVVLGPAAGALTVRFDMPGVTRDRRGEPRYTHLSLGPASADYSRVYYGHGYVLSGCEHVDIGYSGFGLSTRFAGWDYANGFSLVQATTPHPDRILSDRAGRVSTLVASLDAVFTLVPSQRGAFAAARVWRGLAGLKPGGGVSRIAGRMVLDNWGGDYAEMARGLRQDTAYGLDDAIFIRHGWQRWGYDYRLPDIYPPQGDRA